MKDCKGNELNIGDRVIVADVDWCYSDPIGVLKFGTIVTSPNHTARDNNYIVWVDYGDNYIDEIFF